MRHRFSGVGSLRGWRGWRRTLWTLLRAFVLAAELPAVFAFSIAGAAWCFAHHRGIVGLLLLILAALTALLWSVTASPPTPPPPPHSR